MKKIISCPKCNEKMRIPTGKHIRFNCPKCNEKLEFNDLKANESKQVEYTEFSVLPIVDKLPNSFSEVVPFLYILFVIISFVSLRFTESTKIQQAFDIATLSISLIFFVALYQGMSSLYKPMSASISAIIFGYVVMLFFQIINFGKADMGTNATILYVIIALSTIIIEIVFSTRLMTNYRGRLFRLGRIVIFSCSFFIILLIIGTILRMDNSISEKVFDNLLNISLTFLGIWYFYTMKKLLSK